MQQLNEVELDLELLLRRVQGDTDLYGDAMELEQSLSGMKHYLRKVIREYELRLGDFSGEPPMLLLSELGMLQKFIGSATGNEIDHFWRGYVEPAYGAIRSAQALIRL